MNVDTVRTYGSIAVSALIASGFILALVISYLSQDQTNTSLLVGAIIANFSTAVSYWLGSSAGSRSKDDVIAEKEKSKEGS
jgi:hypothetical protein